METRTFKGLRGWSGKPLHPPLTDIPIAGYVLAAVFDVTSTVAGPEHGWARDLWHAGTFLFLAGSLVAVAAAITGLSDAKSSSEAGTQARRTINTHAAIMITATALAVADLGWRLNDYNAELVTPGAVALLSVFVAMLVSVGATFGGALVFEYGFNVETAGDHAAWHKSESDVLPGPHGESGST